MYCDEVLYMWNRPPSEKWCSSENIQPSHAERFVCCALTIQYITYSMVGRSIASISDLGGIFTSAQWHLGPGYRPHYHTAYYTWRIKISNFERAESGIERCCKVFKAIAKECCMHSKLFHT